MNQPELTRVFQNSKTGWFRARTYHEHGVISREVRHHVDLTRARVLDFGCGAMPLAAASIALRYPHAEVVGTDIVPIKIDVTRAHMAREAGLDLPANFSARTVGPSALPEDLGSFDLIYSWSVFEHIIPITEVPACFAAIRDRLRPDGVFHLQIGGLFFSHDGSHLRSITEDWAHLLYPIDELKRMVFATSKPESSKEFEWQQFVELNRLTADDFMEMAEASGFRIVKQERISVGEPPSRLLRIYSREVLTTQEIRAILKRA